MGLLPQIKGREVVPVEAGKRPVNANDHFSKENRGFYGIPGNQSLVQHNLEKQNQEEVVALCCYSYQSKHE